MNFNAPVNGKELDRNVFVCFTVNSETHSHPYSPRQTRRRAPLHHPDPPWLLAPSHHPPFLRLCRLRPGQGPPGLGFDRQLRLRTIAYPGGRTKQISLSAQQKPLVQQWLRNYRKLRATLERICELNHQLLRPEKKS